MKSCAVFRHAVALLLLGAAAAPCVSAIDLFKDQLQLHGSIYSDMLIPQNDETTNAKKEEDFQTNTYMDLWLQSKYLQAGVRLEYLDHPLPGFEPGFQGWGVPYWYVKGTPARGIEITGGDFYETFGNGLIFRAYEDRPIGFDNAVRGGRIRLTRWKGITFKALGGFQRHYWDWNTKSWMAGADLDLEITQWWRQAAKAGVKWTVGGAWVLRHQKDETIMVPGENLKLKLPLNVNAFDIRTRLNYKGWGLYGEAAFKDSDPSADNNYTYGRGHSEMLSLTWGKRGKAFMVQARRTDNMAFRGERSVYGNAGFINRLPPFTMQHTYTLPSLYPYATRPARGEWAFQGEGAIFAPKGSALGGRYGTRFRLAASMVKTLKHDVKMGEPGHDSPNAGGYFSMGHLIYSDINFTVEKRVSRPVTLTFMYMNQVYDKAAVEGEGDMIHANIFVGEGKFNLTPRIILRTEAQYMITKDDEGDWLSGLAELTFQPHWSVSISDLWNVGDSKIHYFQGGVVGSYGACRFSVAYGRTRAGYNCSGGVCRWVPATKGFALGFNYSF